MRDATRQPGRPSGIRIRIALRWSDHATPSHVRLC
jgi:hypothetical protein